MVAEDEEEEQETRVEHRRAGGMARGEGSLAIAGWLAANEQQSEMTS